MLSKIVAKLIMLLLPSEKWYKAAFIMSKYYAYIIGPPSERAENSFRKTQSIKLDTLLSRMGSDANPPHIFPIPVRGNGEEILKKSRPNVLLVCSLHFPLVLVGGMRYILKSGLMPDAILVRSLPKYNDDGYMHIFGTSARIPTILIDSTVLIKVRGILRRGGIVIVLVDENLSAGNYSPNVFRLAEKLNSDMIYSLVKLQSNGCIDVNMFEFPKAASAEEDSVALKINTLSEQVTNLLNHK